MPEHPLLKEGVIPRSELWYWGENAGGHLYGLQKPPKHVGQMIRMFPEGFVHWCLDTFKEKEDAYEQVCMNPTRVRVRIRSMFL